MPAGQQVALQPCLAGVLAEDLQHAPALGDRWIVRAHRPFVLPGCRLEDRREPVGGHLIGTDNQKVVRVLSDHVAQVAAEDRRVRRRVRAAFADLHGIGMKIGPVQFDSQCSAIGMGIRPHASFGAGDRVLNQSVWPAFGIEQLGRHIGSQPLTQ